MRGQKMRVLVLNGSPKGKYSITLQTSLFLEKKFPGHEFQFLHVGQTIRSLDKDFSKAADAISDADLIIFSYPVYTFIAPSQLHRFIELLKSSGLDVSGKFVTQITTSRADVWGVSIVRLQENAYIRTVLMNSCAMRSRRRMPSSMRFP